jgi:SAM-dependent methyltransferase
MIEKAKKSINDPKVNFINTDIMKLEANKKFDLIFSIRAFEYIENKEPFLKKCRDMLAPKGKLFIITKTRRSYWYGKSKIRKILEIIAPFLFYYERNILSKVGSKSRPGFCQKRISVKSFVILLKKIGFNNLFISPVIIRPPIFMRGKTEIPIIPPFLEKPTLAFFKLVDKTFCNNPSFTIFAESYLIVCKKK